MPIAAAAAAAVRTRERVYNVYSGVQCMYVHAYVHSTNLHYPLFLFGLLFLMSLTDSTIPIHVLVRYTTHSCLVNINKRKYTYAYTLQKGYYHTNYTTRYTPPLQQQQQQQQPEEKEDEAVAVPLQLPNYDYYY